jgi:hypothetical protein
MRLGLAIKAMNPPQFWEGEHLLVMVGKERNDACRERGAN